MAATWLFCVASGLLPTGLRPLRWCASASPRCNSPVLRARTTTVETNSPTIFEVSVDLGEGSGIVDGDLPALFSNSVLLTVRYPLPFALEADPKQGVVRVVKPGNGLQVGDVLRACSTPELRYDSTRKRLCYGAGFRGKRPPSERVESYNRDESWLGGIGEIFQRATAELGGFQETQPDKVLFIADGRPYQQVTDALTANSLDRGVESIVMLFERPVRTSAAGTGNVAAGAGGPATLPQPPPAATSSASFVPRQDEDDEDEDGQDLGSLLLGALRPRGAPLKRPATKRDKRRRRGKRSGRAGGDQAG